MTGKGAVMYKSFFIAILLQGAFISVNLVAQEMTTIRDLFVNPEFQKQFAQDLDITDAQGGELLQVGSDVRDKLQNMFRSNASKLASAEHRMEAVKTMREEGLKISAEVEERLGKILNSKQMTVYQERTFQMGGGLQGMLLNPSSGRTLNLTPDQFRQIENIRNKITEEGLVLFDKMKNATPEERAAIVQQLRALGEKGAKMIEAILTDEQKVKALKLTDEMPDYIWKRLPKNRGQERAWRPGADSWKPGQGAPQGVDLPREERIKPRNSDHPFPSAGTK